MALLSVPEVCTKRPFLKCSEIEHVQSFSDTCQKSLHDNTNYHVRVATGKTLQ